MSESNKKHVQYINTNVYDEAKNRIRDLLHQFDQIWVACSWGKDSLVCVKLVEEVYAEEGIEEKVNILFRDEELIPDVIIDFGRKITESGHYNVRWYCVPMKVGKFIMGKHMPFTAWDKSREWHRQPPPYAIMDIEGADELYENDMDGLIFQGEKGKICVITGVRADESLKRYQSCVIKKNDNYIAHTSAKNVMLAKPVYDWSETDVFKYFYEAGVQYCPSYDSQMWVGCELRVASLLHERAIPNLLKCKRMYPIFYQQIVDLMPEVETQVRYWNDYDAGNVMYKYPPTFDGVRAYIKENLDKSVQVEALAYVDESERFRNLELKNYPDRPLGRLPVKFVFESVLKGSFVKAVVGPVDRVTMADLDFEERGA